MSRQVPPVSWRTLLAGFAGVLLPLPLILLLGGTLRPAAPETTAGGRRISPMLENGVRMQMNTYRRSCGPGRPCEPPLACLWDTRIPAAYCTDSQCITDMQCPEEQVCRNVATEEDGLLVKFCVPQGKRQEGERCLAVTLEKEAACTAELLCGGQRGWCARPCRPGATEACPDGFFCADTIPEPVCLPTCEARGCPAGQQCIRYEGGASACAKVYGSNCQQSPCADGRECDLRADWARPGYVWMECSVLCGDGFPPCTDGMICSGWQCRPACDPQGPDVCGEGYRCRQYEPESPYACQPEWLRP